MHDVPPKFSRIEQASALAPPYGSDRSYTSTSHANAHAPPAGEPPCSTAPLCAPNRPAARLYDVIREREDRLDADIANLSLKVQCCIRDGRMSAAREAQDLAKKLIASRSAGHVARLERERGLR